MIGPATVLRPSRDHGVASAWTAVWGAAFLILRCVAASSVPFPDGSFDLEALPGDRAVSLYWDSAQTLGTTRFHVERASDASREFVRITPVPIDARCLADVRVTNGVPYTYRVQAISRGGGRGGRSDMASATAAAFADTPAFLDLLEHTAFHYFWNEAHPETGLVRDRSTPDSPASIAATGFGLSAIPIGIDRGWISREDGAKRVAATLTTFLRGTQSSNSVDGIGYRGWFYHFLDRAAARRVWKCELSSIDTVLFLAGALDAARYFDGADPVETGIREASATLLQRVDWAWMLNGDVTFAMGWHPETGFIPSRWTGYNEAMILYVLALGSAPEQVPDAAWPAWTRGYDWQTSFGQSYVHFAPLFGHQYSHAWIDFRNRADRVMKERGITYFENSRRATLAQQAYCVANPGQFPGYGPLGWGLTACDGPGVNGFAGYRARGAPPAEADDGTLAPTAVAGSLPFVPELCTATLRQFYDAYRPQIWRAYGFCDAFNLKAEWWAPDVVGIDQGAMLLMIENHRTGSVWKRFMEVPEIQRGLERAGFEPFALPPAAAPSGAPN